MQMPFGKHAGEEIEDIPEGYLRWVLDNVELRDPRLREAIEDALGEEPVCPDCGMVGFRVGDKCSVCGHARGEATRGSGPWSRKASGGTGATTTPSPPPKPPPTDKGRLTREVIDAVNRMRRKLAAQFHPDRGGDPVVMTAINGAADDLVKAIEAALARA